MATAVAVTRTAAEEIKALIKANPSMSFKDKDFQRIGQLLQNMTEIRKPITGAETPTDVQRNKDNLLPGWLKGTVYGADVAMQAIEDFAGHYERGYDKFIDQASRPGTKFAERASEDLSPLHQFKARTGRQ